MDSLPVELLEKIFSYLNGWDIIRCEIVCKKWKEVCSNDVLWKKLCLREYPKELMFFEDDHNPDLSVYKECYMRSVRSTNNWKDDDYWTWNINGIITVFYIGNEAVAGVVLTDSRIHVFDLNARGETKMLQEFKPFSKQTIRPHCFDVYNGDKWIVFKYKEDLIHSMYFTYYWDKSHLHKGTRFHCVRHPRQKLIACSCAETNLIGVINDTFILLDLKLNIIYFFDGQSIVFEIENCFDTFICGQTLFAYFGDSFVGMNDKGEDIVKLDLRGVDINLFFLLKMHYNNDIILAEFRGETPDSAHDNNRKAVGWLWKESSKILPTVVESEHNLVLHPVYKHVCYVRTPGEKYEVVTVEIDTGNLISVVPFTLHFINSTFDTFLSGPFMIIQNRFALITPDFDTRFPDSLATYWGNILVDLMEGKVVFQLDFETYRVTRGSEKILESFMDCVSCRYYKLRIFT